MNNKEQIKKLRDNAELAWASYGYFDFIDKQYSFDEKDKDKFKTLYAKINDLKKSDEKYKMPKLPTPTFSIWNIIPYLMANSPHSKPNNSLKDMIY
nr:hypothetical protein [Campylobacter jejuni]